MDLKTIVKNAISEAVTDAQQNAQVTGTGQPSNSQQTQGVPDTQNATQGENMQTQNNAAAEQQQMQQQTIQNKFNEISNLIANVDNAASQSMENAIKSFTEGVKEIGQCSKGFNAKYAKALAGAMQKLQNGNAELNKVKQAFVNFQKLSQNIKTMVGQQ